MNAHSSVLIVMLSLAPGPGLWGEPLELRLAECVAMGVTRNLELAARRLGRDEDQLAFEVARRLFVPRFTSRSIRTFHRGENLRYQAAVTGLSPDGGSYQVRAEGSQALDPSSRSDTTVAFSINRPLLRNFGRRVVGRDLDVGRIDGEIAVALFAGQLNALILRIAETYFDLHLAREDLKIQELAHQRALTQYEETRDDIERGVLAGQEIYLVEENVVRFEINMRNARRDIANNEMVLAALLNLDIAGHTEIVPTEPMRRDLEGLDPFAGSRTRMLANNPEYRVQELASDRSRIDREFFENQVRPILDIFADHRLSNGLVGARAAESQLGVRFEIPFSRRPDRARAQQARLRVERESVSVEDRQVQLSYELKRLYLDLETQAAILALRARARALSQKKLEAEQSKYKNGISTLIDVVRFQQELESSMIQEIRTLVTLNKLWIQKGRLEGLLYRDFDLSIQ